MKPFLTKLTLRGFKTIRELTDFNPGRLTILIGPNGAGKSNLISFFTLLSNMVADGLTLYVAQQGGASLLLYDGPPTTREIDVALEFETERGSTKYGFRLAFAGGDALVFAGEWVAGTLDSTDSFAAEKGHRESILTATAVPLNEPARLVVDVLRRLIVYQFDNTSPQARIRTKWSPDDGLSLKSDGGNLASFLYRLQIYAPECYRRITETLRLVLPFFSRFELQPEQDYLLLRWRELGSDRVFSASQAGDGMLRIMALVALLQQPEKDLPGILILDEPELGLHPYALEMLSALIQSASQYCQIIIATQSVSLIDRFEPHDIVVTERSGRESKFRRLSDSELSEWLEEYTLSELWEKNVLGGRPSR